MKKFLFLIVAIIIAVAMVFMTNNSAPTDWVQVYSEPKNEKGITTKVFVDKNSIKRGIEFEKFNYSRSDGFSASVKVEVEDDEGKSLTTVMFMGFFEEDGVKKCALFKIYGEQDGKSLPLTLDEPKVRNADGSEGTTWPAVWEYIEKNLP